MKIAMIIDAWDPIIGGGQVYTRYLIKYLVGDFDSRVDLFTRKLVGDDGKVFEEDETLLDGKWNVFRTGPTTPFFHLFGRLANLFIMTIFLYRKAKTERYDIIHAHAVIGGLPAKIVGWLCGIPVAYTVHGTMNMDTGTKGLMAYLESIFITKIPYDLEFTVSQKLLDYKNCNKNIVVIPPGVEVEKFRKREELKKHEGINFLFVGRFDWHKGLSYLMETISLIDIKLLREKGFHLNLVGGGYLFADIEKMVQEKGIQEFVSFLGKLPDNELIEEYQKNHIFILPSLSEGQPVVVFEAFASGIPVLVTDVGDNKYYVSPENGYIIPPGNVAELKKQIEKVLKMDITELEKMGENGKEMVIGNLSWEKIVKRIYKEYVNLL